MGLTSCRVLLGRTFNVCLLEGREAVGAHAGESGHTSCDPSAANGLGNQTQQARASQGGVEVLLINQAVPGREGCSELRWYIHQEGGS